MLQAGLAALIDDISYAVWQPDQSSTSPSSPATRPVEIESGSVLSLGRDGCQPMRQRGGQTRQFRIRKPGYYPWSISFALPPKASRLTLPVALFPDMQTPRSNGVGVALQWCGHPLDLDLWVSVPKGALKGCECPSRWPVRIVI
eukprot:2934609-Rhodomonas_salina.2